MTMSIMSRRMEIIGKLRYIRECRDTLDQCKDAVMYLLDRKSDQNLGMKVLIHSLSDDKCSSKYFIYDISSDASRMIIEREADRYRDENVKINIWATSAKDVEILKTALMMITVPNV